MRGNPPARDLQFPVPGSIPACAGEPDQPCLRTGELGVYPRVCGGTPSTKATADTRFGLSPRVRGNLYQTYIPYADGGSIPACAGEPHSEHGTFDRTKVYPRVCGGTGQGGSFGYTLTGLSPRVRGNLRVARNRRLQQGSIPACAGEPCFRLPPIPDEGVYPRVCGGTDLATPYAPVKEGLSPRVRGNPARTV